jgi:hypothetical protein
MPQPSEISRFRAFLADRGHAADWPESQLWLALELADRLRYPGQPRDSHGRFAEGKSGAAKAKEEAKRQRIAAKAAAKEEHRDKKRAAAEASQKAQNKGTQTAQREAARAQLAAADAALRAGRPAQAKTHGENAARHSDQLHTLKQAARAKNAAVPFDVPAKAGEVASLNPNSRAGRAIQQAARENSLPPEHLAAAAQYVHEMAMEVHRDKEAAKEDARRLTGLTAGDIARMENAGHDYASRPEKIGGATGEKMRHFDEYAQEIASAHPGVIGNLAGHWPEKEDLSMGLWDLLREGKQRAPQIYDQDILRQALKHAGSHANRQSMNHLEEEFGEF